jgi:hypothetical protein
VALAAKKTDGKLLVSIHLRRELAKRAKIQLRTWTLDGKREALTWHYHSIPIGESLKNEERKKE